MPSESVRDNELANNIDKARKQVTILFTDIVDSSRYWDMFGDVKGRLMVDRHNRLVFPVIKKYHGRVVKTIGDGLMAVFKRPNDALHAAIGIQQILHKMRVADRTFHAKVRIGLHTGMAIVEQNDVYGDAVNVAKRVESFGDANEIFLSEATAQGLVEKKHSFHKKGSFIPKGKRDPITVFRCRWNEYKDLARGLKVTSDFPLDAREKGDLVAYSLIFFIVISILYISYVRYLLADVLIESPQAQLFALNPLLLFSELPFLPAVLLAVLLVLILLLIRIKTAPYIFLRLLKGVAGLGLGFVLIYIPVNHFKIDFATGPGHEIYKTKTVFAVLNYTQAKKANTGIRQLRGEQNYYVFFDRDLVVPVISSSIAKGKNPTPGVWTEATLRQQGSQPFYFRLLDLCALSLGILGFVSGFMNFAIRPT